MKWKVYGQSNGEWVEVVSVMQTVDGEITIPLEDLRDLDLLRIVAGNVPDRKEPFKPVKKVGMW